jgi:aspartate/methionine/tyrosine aminotransferase
MNPRVTALGPSAIRALHARRRPSSIDLGLGEPTLLPDVANFEAATRWVAVHGCRYSSNAGDRDLREAIAARYGYPGLDSADNVCVTTGSQEAVYVAMKTVLDPARDEVLIVEPAFPIYAKIAQLEGIAARRVLLRADDGYAFDVDRILEAVGPRTKLLVVCSPCNPTGRVIGDDAVRAIAAGLNARPGPPVYVLHDEIYREQMYATAPGYFGAHYPHTIAVNSLSKSNALTGLRLGWVISPDHVAPQVLKAHAWVTSCASTFAQRVAFEIFESGALRAHSAWYAAQREVAMECARETGFSFVEPEGAFYLCLNVGVADSARFCDALLDERDVVAIPGRIFSEALEGWVRTSFVAAAPTLAEGFRRIAAMAAVSV